MYFAIAIILFVLGLFILSEPWNILWMSGWTLVEAAAIINNIRLGIKIDV